MGATSTFAVATLVPPSSMRSAGRIDFAGATLLGFGLLLPLVAISQTPVWGWGSLKTISLIAAGAIVLVRFVRHEQSHPEPLIDMKTLSRPQIALTNLSTLFVGFGMFGASFIMIQFLEQPVSTGYGSGSSATQAGLFLVPGTALMLLTAPLCGYLASRTGPKTALVLGAGLAGSALAFLAFFNQGLFYLYLWPTMLYVGIGFAFAAMPMLILNAVEPSQRGQATATNQIFRLVGSTIGTQLAATFIAASVGHSGQPTEEGFRRAFIAEALGGFAAVLAAFAIPRLRRTTPQDISPPPDSIVAGTVSI